MAFKEFKGLFIKTEDETNVTEQVSPSTVGSPTQKKSFANSESVQTVPTANVDVRSNTTQTSITADAEIVDKIWDKIIAANRPGPDYLELKNNVEALEDLPISNEQKLLSAFKVLKKGYPNFQKEDITKAIDFYIKVVDDEKNGGLQQLEALKASCVDGVEEEIRSMQFKAEELKRQYDELQTQIGEKTLELTRAKNDIEVKHNSFVSSIEAVLNVLNNDKNNVMAINF